MKKFLCLLLVMIICISLVACTKSPKEEPVTLGSTIDLEYVNMTLDAFEISTEYSFETTDNSSGTLSTYESSIKCSKDMKLICLKGKFINKTQKGVLPSKNPIYGELEVNGNTYKTKMECYIPENYKSVYQLAPLRTADYYLYAEVPVAVADAIESCKLTIGLTEDLNVSEKVSKPEDNDVLYLLETIPANQQ